MEKEMEDVLLPSPEKKAMEDVDTALLENNKAVLQIKENSLYRETKMFFDSEPIALGYKDIFNKYQYYYIIRKGKLQRVNEEVFSKFVSEMKQKLSKKFSSYFYEENPIILVFY